MFWPQPPATSTAARTRHASDVFIAGLLRRKWASGTVPAGPPIVHLYWRACRNASTIRAVDYNGCSPLSPSPLRGEGGRRPGEGAERRRPLTIRKAPLTLPSPPKRGARDFGEGGTYRHRVRTVWRPSGVEERALPPPCWRRWPIGCGGHRLPRPQSNPQRSRAWRCSRPGLSGASSETASCGTCTSARRRSCGGSILPSATIPGRRPCPSSPRSTSRRPPTRSRSPWPPPARATRSITRGPARSWARPTARSPSA